MNIVYSEKSAKQLKRMIKGDRKSATMIFKEIERYANKSESNCDIKILKGKFSLFKRLRVGNYRIIFEEKDDIMYIYEIKHRKEAYND